MFFKRKNEKNNDTLLLKGYVSNEDEYESRAELLYDNPDNEKPKKMQSEDEVEDNSIQLQNHSQKNIKPVNHVSKAKVEKETPARDLKQQRKYYVKELNRFGQRKVGGSIEPRKYYNKPLSFIGRRIALGKDFVAESADYIMNGRYKWRGEIPARVFGVDADENLHMALADTYLDTPFARQHKVFNSVSEVSPFLRGFVEYKIESQLGRAYVNEIKGIFIDNDSEASKRLAKNSDIYKYVRENKDYLSSFGTIKKGSIQFTDTNFYNAIGKADIIDMNVNSNNEITFYVVDTYDFNANSTNPLVRAGRINQEYGRLIPYFIIYSVKIDRNTSERYLR